MFDRKSGEADKKAREREAEARKVEALKASIVTTVDGMKIHALAPNPDQCEAAAKRVTELLKNPKAPRDFILQMRNRSDDLIRSCFMKAASEASSGALVAAHHDDKDLRSKKIGEARKYLARAIQLKAPVEFKLACNRAIEVAAMTGFVTNHGPTKAKPADVAPKTVNRAHGAAPMKFETVPAERPRAQGSPASSPATAQPGRLSLDHQEGGPLSFQRTRTAQIARDG